MRICVYGLWHLGSVTAACVAEHFDTVGCDPDSNVVQRLAEGDPPLFEPGLAELVAKGLRSGRLRFSTDVAEAVGHADVIWVTFDTPVNSDDVADVPYVERQVESIFPHLRDGSTLLISSQIPVGCTRKLQHVYQSHYPSRTVTFACSPENLRLGKALIVFQQPERIVVGTSEERSRETLHTLLSPFSSNIEWMGIESAEMTKHALNAFMATSVCFANEIASICEQVGADAKEVERGLKTDSRIGPGAYLSPGSAFAGGTLARDVSFLHDIGKAKGLMLPLVASIRPSNEHHKQWHRRKLHEALGSVSNKTIAVLGLTYKPGTDTLRRSSSLELASWLTENGATVNGYDPAIVKLPSDVDCDLRVCASVDAALNGSDAAVIATAWPEFRQITADQLVSNMRNAIVLDSARVLGSVVSRDERVRYMAVGAGK